MNNKINGMAIGAYLNSRSIKKDNGCIEWVGSVYSKGHGHFNLKGRHLRAHRVAYELEFGGIPDRMCVCHKCDNPRCINAAHLFLGTISDNNRDMVSKNRHAHGSRNGAAKLTDLRVKVVRNFVKNGHSISGIARRLGISQSTLSMAVSGKTWRHVKD